MMVTATPMAMSSGPLACAADFSGSGTTAQVSASSALDTTIRNTNSGTEKGRSSGPFCSRTMPASTRSASETCLENTSLNTRLDA